MDINLTANYKLTDENIYELFWNSLCSGSIGYGIVTLDCDSKEDYEAAREAVKILKAGSAEDYVNGDYYICSEDVWTQLLKMGKLTFVEYDEWDDTNSYHRLSIEDMRDHLHDMQRNEPWILDDFAKGEDDGDTHDAFLQCLILGAIVYG